MGESITTARHGLKTLSTHCSGPSEIKLWDFLYSEWGEFMEQNTRYVEPFRSVPREVLAVVGAQLVVQRHTGKVHPTGVSPVALAAGWSRLTALTHYLVPAQNLMSHGNYAGALDHLRQTPSSHAEYAQAVALCG